MRTTLLAFSAACVLLTTLNHRATAAPNPDAAASPPIETLSERNPDRWQGRQHYLYDDENRSDPATTGSAASDARACANEPVRLRRSDGTTVVRRLKRCD
jgi:hypothetical protein